MNYSLTSLFAILGQIAAGLTALAVVWKFIGKPIVQGFKRISEVYIAVDNINKEFQRNGGGSLRDAVDRIEKTTTHQEERQRILLGLVPFGVIETDTKGHVTFVNRTYLRWTGKEEHELLGEGWVSIIHPDDRERIVREWREAVEQLRSFESRFKLISANGASYIVYSRAIPMYSKQVGRPILGYVAIIAKCMGDVECPLYDGGLPTDASCVWNGCILDPQRVKYEGPK